MRSDAAAAFVLVQSFAVFVLIATVDRPAVSARNAARGALVARVGGDRPALFGARLRNFNNLGVILGTLGAAFALQAGSRAAHTVLVLANAASFVLCALLHLRVPDHEVLPRPVRQRRWTASRRTAGWWPTAASAPTSRWSPTPTTS
ncbi:hypothetical protein [Kitasatospora sp. NPDC057223]|uniref:hypothetical protein n=1 Tax=Kitasatospora sp. NPDC057223 TaxID=3346055 RepID=UPI0036421604